MSLWKRLFSGKNIRRSQAKSWLESGFKIRAYILYLAPELIVTLILFAIFSQLEHIAINDYNSIKITMAIVASILKIALNYEAIRSIKLEIRSEELDLQLNNKE